MRVKVLVVFVKRITFFVVLVALCVSISNAILAMIFFLMSSRTECVHQEYHQDIQFLP